VTKAGECTVSLTNKSTYRTLYRAKCNVADDVITGVTTVDHTLNLRVAEPHGSRRETVGDVRFNAFVITCVTAWSSNQRQALSSGTNKAPIAEQTCVDGMDVIFSQYFCFILLAQLAELL